MLGILPGRTLVFPEEFEDGTRFRELWIEALEGKDEETFAKEEGWNPGTDQYAWLTGKGRESGRFWVNETNNKVWEDFLKHPRTKGAKNNAYKWVQQLKDVSSTTKGESFWTPGGSIGVRWENAAKLDSVVNFPLNMDVMISVIPRYASNLLVSVPDIEVSERDSLKMLRESIMEFYNISPEQDLMAAIKKIKDAASRIDGRPLERGKVLLLRPMDSTILYPESSKGGLVFPSLSTSTGTIPGLTLIQVCYLLSHCITHTDPLSGQHHPY